MFYIYVWNKRITLKILPCMAALNTFRTDGEDFGEQILSKVVKAGRRTYFLDVRATRANDYFLTITESRKKTAPDGTVSYDRHKIFLYKEDFSKFLEGLEEVIGFIKREKPEFFEEEPAIDSNDEIQIVRTKKFGIKPMFPEDACVQMELLGHDFFVFSNAETEEVNVVYKRKNGTFGLIEPEFQ